MGTDLNFGEFGGGGGGGVGRGSGVVGRQSSIFSLTLDELQNSVGGGLGKDFGSMNMDELLKNIWSAEEMQNMAASCSGAAAQIGGGLSSVGGLQKQGSLTLPRTLSQKTVDEVWKDVHTQYVGGKDGSGTSGAGLQQKQQTLKEITLEEFLVKAGVVREDVNVNSPQALANNNSENNGGPFYSEFSNLNSDKAGSAHGIGFPSSTQIAGAGNQTRVQPPILPLNVNGARSSQQPMTSPRPQQLQQRPQLFPKQQGPPGYTGLMDGGVQLASPRMRGGLVGMSVHNNMVQGAGMGMVGLGAASMNMINESSPSQLSSDGVGKSNGDLTSVSPVPYVFSGGIRGRRANGALEKVVERRQRRMIKNRESAARSRARKQAYTMELEAEVAKLKAENQELQRKQEEFMKLQENQVIEAMSPGSKRQCLRRTQSSPW